MNASPGVEDDLVQRYSAIRAAIGHQHAISVLHIGEEQTTVASDPGVAGVHAPLVQVLAIGAHRTARAHFHHTPPSPLELENAIATVEDEIMRVHRQMQPGTRLYSSDPAIRAIAALSGVPEAPQMQLSLDAVERTFERLTSLALGSPASLAGLPASHGFAMTLLILREFMHHLQHASITLLG